MSSRIRILLAAGLLCLAVMLALTARGYFKSVPTVAGTVSVGGLPLQEGAITFFPIEGTAGGTTGEKIIEGKFEVPEGLTVGKYCIAIEGTRPDPVAKILIPFTDKWIPMPVQVVPKVYRGQDSPLIETVKGGHQSFSFDLPEISANKSSR